MHWNLKFDLATYTPSEAEALAGVSTAMQRDWRHRGFGPRYEKHARFTIFDIAELYVMKAYSGQGRGPSQSAQYAARMSAPIVRSGISYFAETVHGMPSVHLFKQIPRTMRPLSRNEQIWLEAERRGYKPAGFYDEVELDDDGVRYWISEQLFSALDMDNPTTARHAVWWPNDLWEMVDYDTLMSSGTADVDDERFDGPALVFDIDQVAKVLAARSPRPWVSVDLSLSDAVNAGKVSLHVDGRDFSSDAA